MREFRGGTEISTKRSTNLRFQSPYSCLLHFYPPSDLLLDSVHVRPLTWIASQRRHRSSPEANSAALSLVSHPKSLLYSSGQLLLSIFSSSSNPPTNEQIHTGTSTDLIHSSARAVELCLILRWTRARRRGGGGGGASGCDGGLGPAPRLDPERPQHHQQGPPRRGWALYWDECAALPAIIPSDRHRTAGGRWTSNGPGHGPAKGPVHTQPIARSKVQRLARTLIHVPVST